MNIGLTIRFTEKHLTLPSATGKILKIVALPKHPGDFICVNHVQEIWRINSITTNSHLICKLPDFELSEKTPIQIQISPCCNYLALTRINYSEDNNYGLVININNGEKVFELKDFGYHSEHADFPVTFFQHNDTCHLIYASDWNNLDIIDLKTGKCLTARTNDEINDSQRENSLFTEWTGELKISPDGKRIATIGWMWHPVGIAWNFSLENWLTDKWEADFGKSKTQLGDVWDGFWHSSFAWLDNDRIIIWGDPNTQNSHDIPANNVVIYNAITGEKLSSFDGPTLDIFEIDGSLLFSGKPDGTGISMWNWEKGELINDYITDNRVLAYHPDSKHFILRNAKDELVQLEWALIENDQ